MFARFGWVLGGLILASWWAPAAVAQRLDPSYRCSYGPDGACIPNCRSYGYSPTHWRRWPLEESLDETPTEAVQPVPAKKPEKNQGELPPPGGAPAEEPTPKRAKSPATDTLPEPDEPPKGSTVRPDDDQPPVPPRNDTPDADAPPATAPPLQVDPKNLLPEDGPPLRSAPATKAPAAKTPAKTPATDDLFKENPFQDDPESDAPPPKSPKSGRTAPATGGGSLTTTPGRMQWRAGGRNSLRPADETRATSESQPREAREARAANRQTSFDASNEEPGNPLRGGAQSPLRRGSSNDGSPAANWESAPQAMTDGGGPAGNPLR